MGFDNIGAVAKAVILNKTVWITFVIVALVLSFASFVANYTKKPKAPKISRPKPAPAPAAAPENGEEAGGNDAADE